MDLRETINRNDMVSIDINRNPSRSSRSSYGRKDRSTPIHVNIDPSSSSSSSNEESNKPVKICDCQSFCQRLGQYLLDRSPVECLDGNVAGTLAIICSAVVAVALPFVVFALTNCVPIATIVVGALYQDESHCPAVEKMSVLLIVGGSIALFRRLPLTISNISIIIQSAFGKNIDQNQFKNSYPKWLRILIQLWRLVSIGWFAAAGIMVYGVRTVVDFQDKKSTFYCHPVLYLFTFWYVTAALILIGFVGGVRILLIWSGKYSRESELC